MAKKKVHRVKKTTNGIVNGMSAYHKHGEPSDEMKKIFKKNGSLSDYKPEKSKVTDESDILDFINKKFR